MNRIASALAYAGTVTAATLAATLMAGNALAETPTIDTTPFVSTLSRAQVQAEVMRVRSQLSAGGKEWAMQYDDPQPLTTGVTRAETTAAYIAAREQVRAINSEDSGSSYFAQARARRPAAPMASMSVQ